MQKQNNNNNFKSSLYEKKLNIQNKKGSKQLEKKCSGYIFK